jgi:hypothetical protein
VNTNKTVLNNSKKFLLVCSIFIVSSCFSQTWTTINETSGNFSFQMPSTPQKYDTLNSLMYFYTIDSIALEVHSVCGIALTDSSMSPDSLGENLSPLDLFARVSLESTNGALTCNTPVTINGYIGREVGFYYLSAMDVNVYTFSEVLIFRNHFVTLSITAPQSYLSELLSYKDQFFNSLQIN